MATTVKNKLPSLDSLPVEILYRILDHVDEQTILFRFAAPAKSLRRSPTLTTDTNSTSVRSQRLTFVSSAVLFDPKM
jgi:hypothetical protein